MMQGGIKTCRVFLVQLSIKYSVHFFVLCCKYMQNAQYTQFKDWQKLFKI